ncbi:FLYWCH zinc finger domain-containing protein [Phthorimaea operculella]|nr:FLYWCH zinc finger domain-containing protein [Phthorimaea operculella]
MQIPPTCILKVTTNEYHTKCCSNTPDENQYKAGLQHRTNTTALPHLEDEVIRIILFTSGTNGKPLAVYQDYCFNFHFKGSKANRWRCRANYDKCRATLVTTFAGELIHANTKHNHPSARFVIKKWFGYITKVAKNWRYTKDLLSSCIRKIKHPTCGGAPSQVVGADSAGQTSSPLKPRQLRWIKAGNGKSTIIIYDGYSFYHQKVQNSAKNMRWACMKMKLKCRACLTITKEGEVIRVNAEHNHPPPAFEIRDGVYTKIKTK